MRPHGSVKVLAARRHRALALLDEGLNLSEVARQTGCAPSSVMRWRDQRAREGNGVFIVRASPGRPNRLSPRQEQKLARILIKGPMASGFTSELWTTARVAEVILWTFGVRYHPDHVGRLLHRIGFSCQKPDRRAMERKEDLIERWKKEEWPRIKKTLKTWVPTSSSSTKAAS